MRTFYKEAFFNSRLEMGKVALVPSEPGLIFFDWDKIFFFDRDQCLDQFF